MTDNQPQHRPIGWWLKTADARIEQALEDVFDGQSITRREWQVLEPVSHSPVTESELLRILEAFVGAQGAVDDLRRRGLLASGVDGVLSLTEAGHAARDAAAAGVATVRSVVSGALPGENYATLTRLLADLVAGLDQASKASP